MKQDLQAKEREEIAKLESVKENLKMKQKFEEGCENES